MNAAIRSIAGREIATRWIAIPIAAAFAVLALLVPHLVSEAVEVELGDVAWQTVTIASIAASIFIGMSLVGTELAENRLSFYFTRPLAPRQIFAGKLAGGVVLAISIHAILIIPAGLLLPGGSRLATIGWNPTIAAIAAVGLGIGAGVVIRSRARWLALDVAGIAIVGVVIAAIATHVFDKRGSLEAHRGNAAALRELADQLASLELVALLVVLAAATLAGGLAMSAGRTDRERFHRALSATVWSIVVPASLVAVVIALRW